MWPGCPERGLDRGDPVFAVSAALPMKKSYSTWAVLAVHSGSASQFRANLFVELFLLVKTYSRRVKGTNPALKKPSNIPEIYAKMFCRFH